MFRSRTQILRPLAHCRPQYFLRPSSTLETRSQGPPSNPPLSDQPSHSEQSAQKEQHPPRKPTQRHSAYVRVLQRIHSLPEAYAIIRAIEREFGLVREYKFLRDFELQSTYQTMLYVVFASPESRERIPADSTEIQVPIPNFDVNQPGGVSLQDLQSLLTPVDRPNGVEIPAFGNVMDSVVETGEAQSKSTSQKVVGIRIERSFSESYTPSRLPAFGPARGPRDGVARGFLNWGGFYPIEPIERGTSLYGVNIRSKAVDHLAMRQVLRKWSELSGIPNPYERRPHWDTSAVRPPTTNNETPNVTEVPEQKPTKWEPLPSSNSDPETESAPALGTVAATTPSKKSQNPMAEPATVQVQTPPVPAPTASKQAQPRSTLPIAPKQVPKLSAKRLPNTSEVASKATQILQSSSRTPQPPSPPPSHTPEVKRSQHQQKAKRAHGGKDGKHKGDGGVQQQQQGKPKPPPTKTEGDRGTTDRLKSLFGSWF